LLVHARPELDAPQSKQCWSGLSRGNLKRGVYKSEEDDLEGIGIKLLGFHQALHCGAESVDATEMVEAPQMQEETPGSHGRLVGRERAMIYEAIGQSDKLLLGQIRVGLEKVLPYPLGVADDPVGRSHTF
jgi:hypothetical protein